MRHNDYPEEQLNDPFHNPLARASRALTWIDYIESSAPSFVKKDAKMMEHIRNLVKPGLTIKQLFFLPFILHQLSAVGYPMASIAKIQKPEMYAFKKTFRNEWFQMRGRIRYVDKTEEFISIHIWRHTDMPPAVWERGRDSRDYSSLKMTVQIGSSDVWTSPIVTESWGVLKIKESPFQISFQNNQLLSKSEQTLFPLNLNWQVNQRVLQLEIDNGKPVFMMSSNGCVVCQDGIGLKNYKFPFLSGQGTLDGRPITFEGFYDHSWESGLLPEGYASSVILRTFINVEKSLSDWSSTNFSNWLYVIIQLSNQIQIAFYCLPLPRVLYQPLKLDTLVISQADGTIIQDRTATIVLQLISDANGVESLNLTGKNFALQVTVDVTFTSPKDVFLHFAQKPAHVSGKWDGASVNGFAFVENSMCENTTEFVHGLLDNHFAPELTQGLKQLSRDSNFYGASVTLTDTTYSWLLWFFPVMIITILICLVLYLMWYRQQTLWSGGKGVFRRPIRRRWH